MNNDYLWDQTGEPDPEMQQLEQVLGLLRYRPRPLEIPTQLQSTPLQIGRKQSLFSRFAIAAAIAMMIVGVGLWLVLPREPAADSRAADTTPAVTDSNPMPVASPKANSGNNQVTNLAGVANKSSQRSIREPHRHRTTQPMAARNIPRSRPLLMKGSELTESERVEAETAKEQLLLALRVASSKLNLAQKKAQGTYPAKLIRNQHKVG